MPTTHSQPKRQYQEYGGSNIRDNGPGQPVIAWQQMPRVGQDTDTTSFTALLNSPLDPSVMGSPVTASPVANPPTDQAIVRHNNQFQGLPHHSAHGGYRQNHDVPFYQSNLSRVFDQTNQTNHSNHTNHTDDDYVPRPKRQRANPRPSLFIRELQADQKKREAEYAAAVAAAANPGSSTVDLTDGMSSPPILLRNLSLFPFCLPLIV